MAHADAKTRESVGFVPDNGKAGRPRSPKVLEVLRERVEANVDRYLKPLEDALSAQRGLVVGDGSHARVEYVEDYGTRIKAVREIFDRALGKPTQYVDVTTREEESEVDREIRDLLGQMERLPSSNGKPPAHVNGNGNGKH